MRQVQSASVLGRANEERLVFADSCQLGLGGSIGWCELQCLVTVENADQYVNLVSFGQDAHTQICQRAGVAVLEGKEGFLVELSRIVGLVVGSFSQVDLEAVVAVVWEGQGYFVVVGKGEVCLFRQGVLGKILAGGEELVKVEGEIRAGDVVIMGSGGFFGKVGYVRVTELLLDKANESGVESVASGLVGAVQEAVGVGGVVMKLAASEESGDEDVSKLSMVRKMLLNPREVIGKLRDSRKSSVDEEVYVRDRAVESRSQRFGMVIFGALFLLLLVSVGFGWVRRQAQVRQQRLNEIVVPVERLIEQADVERGVNRLQARNLLAEAREMLVGSVEEFEEGSSERETLSGLLSKVEVDFEAVSGEMALTPGVYLDLSLVKEGFFGEQMALVDGVMYVLDTNGSLLMEVSTENKQARIVAGGSVLASARLVVGGVGLVYVVTDETIDEVDVEDGSVGVAGESEGVWEDVAVAYGFAGNVYVLDRSLGEIWRYRSVAGGLARQRWLAPGVQPDFVGVVDMMIDGDIWVLDSGGLVRRYTRGVGAEVPLVGLNKAIDQATEVFAEEELYVLDRGNNRVIELDLEGVYQRQFEWEGISLVTDMVVIEGKVLLLSGQRIYEIEV